MGGQMRSADYLNIAALVVFILVTIILTRRAGQKQTALDRFDAWFLTVSVAFAYLSTTGFIGWGWYAQAAMAAVFWMLPWSIFRIGRALMRKRVR